MSELWTADEMTALRQVLDEQTTIIAALRAEVEALRAQVGEWETHTKIVCACGQSKCNHAVRIEPGDYATLWFVTEGRRDEMMYLPVGDWRIQRRKREGDA